MSHFKGAFGQDGPETGHQISTQESTNLLAQPNSKSSPIDLREGTVDHKPRS
jgi:hypothetical protein